MSPLFLEPIFQERIWGGEDLKKFGYNIFSDKIGECWGISAHENGSNIILNGENKGKTLRQLWEEDNNLFGKKKSKKFPLLIKILDANDDLSIQVHPNDEYANANENGEYGKTECWYIIDCEEDSEIIFGHNAENKEELKGMIESGQWTELFNKVKVKSGDFYYVPSGTVHAIGKGIQILETQQNSDTTYRIYDYDRKDKEGKTRELHIEKSIDVIEYNKQYTNIVPSVVAKDDAEIKTFISNEFFTVKQLIVDGNYVFDKENEYILCTIIDGEGSLLVGEEKYAIKKGDHFILTNLDEDIEFRGNLNMMYSYD